MTKAVSKPEVNEEAVNTAPGGDAPQHVNIPKALKGPIAAVDETALLDKLQAALGEIQQQLRKGDTVALPGFVERMLPEVHAKGDRAKVLDWRSFVIYAEWTGAAWDVVVYQDGKLRG